MSEQVLIERLKRKIERRDNKITGLERELKKTQQALGSLATTLNRMPLEVEHAVTHALCNVRLIPVLGKARDAKILEVRNFNEPKEKGGA